MSGKAMYRLTWYLYWRWILAALAFTILVPLVVVVVEFPLMLLVAIVSRGFGYPEFATNLTAAINGVVTRPELYGPIFLAVGFFVLRAMLSKAMSSRFDGKVLVLQDAPESSP